MADPFRDASLSPAAQEAQRKLDEFTVSKLANYVTDDESIIDKRPVPESLTKPAPAPKRSLKIKHDSDASKSKPSKGKTPVKANLNTHQTPARKSTRTTAGKKRKALESSSDAEDESLSPLAKKFKSTKAMSDSLLAAKPPASASKITKKADPVSKSKPQASGAADMKSNVTAAPKATANTSKKRPRTPEQDDEQLSEVDSSRRSRAKKPKKTKVTDEADDLPELSSSPPPKGKKTKKTKKTKTNAADEAEELKQFEATADSSGNGFSTERPNCATLDEPWKCANRTCNTGMTWCNKGDGSEKSNGYGRKACSHYFGRNKKETSYVHEYVWHYYCRKCYQRSAYRAKSSKTREQDSESNALVKLHVDTLRHQIVRLQLWRPEMVFKVQLIKAAKTRLAEYHKVLNRGTKAEAIEAVRFVTSTTSNGKVSKPRPEHEFPIEQINHIDYRLSGPNKTYSDLQDICDWIDELNEAGDAPCDPPIEFLPSAEADGEKIINPLGTPDNYDRWAHFCDAQAQGVQADDADDEDDEKNEADETDAGGNDEDSKPTAAGDYGSGSDDDEDDEVEAPVLRKAPVKSSSFLKTTELGRRLGFQGNAGIFRGSGLRVDREREARERQEAIEREGKDMEGKHESRHASSEDPKIKVESEE